MQRPLFSLEKPHQYLQHEAGGGGAGDTTPEEVDGWKQTELHLDSMNELASKKEHNRKPRALNPKPQALGRVGVS